MVRFVDTVFSVVPRAIRPDPQTSIWKHTYPFAPRLPQFDHIENQERERGSRRIDFGGGSLRQNGNIIHQNNNRIHPCHHQRYYPGCTVPCNRVPMERYDDISPYAKNMSIHAVLGEKGIDYQETIAHIRLAIGFFSAHQYASSTAQSAVLKIMRLMDRLQDNQHGPQSVSPQTTNDIGISMFDSPDQPLDFLSQLSDPTFIFADHSLPNYFSISPGKDNEQTRTTVWRGENEHQPFYGSLG